MNVRIALLGVLILLLGYLSYLIVRPFTTFVIAAILLAFVLMPLHDRLSPHIGDRPSAFVLVAFAFSATLAPLAIIGYLMIDTLDAVTEGIDHVVIVQRVEELVFAFTGVEIDLVSEINAVVQRLAQAALGELTDILAATFHFVIGLLLLVFLLYYLILDGSRFVRWIIDLTPLERDVQRELYREAHVITWAVLKSHIFVAFIQGGLMGIGFYIAGVPNASFWTAIMIVLAILPVVGVSLIWAPATIFLFYVNAPLAAAFLLIYGAIVVNLDNYIRALLVDRESDLHPAVVLIGVLGGLYVFGILGLFVGPIVLAIFKATLTVFGNRVTHELSDQSV